jgi:hypothetical protein
MWKIGLKGQFYPPDGSPNTPLHQNTPKLGQIYVKTAQKHQKIAQNSSKTPKNRSKIGQKHRKTSKNRSKSVKFTCFPPGWLSKNAVAS